MRTKQLALTFLATAATSETRHAVRVSVGAVPSHLNLTVVLCVWCRLAAPAVRIGDDLAFAICQDPETGGLIRHLQRQKEAAVSGKDVTVDFLCRVCCVQLLHCTQVKTSVEQSC